MTKLLESPEAGVPPSIARPRGLAARALLWSIVAGVPFFLLCCVTWGAVHRHCEGRFLFTLDDPYIQLELANNIARHGHYGINLNAPSSPSSSILWPYLLAPLAHFNSPLTAFALNLVFAAATILLIGFVVASLAKRSSPLDDRARRVVAAFCLVFIASLPSLVFVGMEHTMQVFLAGMVAWGFLRALDGRPIPAAAIFAAAVLPSVRYEGLAITLALAIALYAQRRPRLAVALLLVSVLPLAGFSLYLHHLGLPLLPTSVIIKSAVLQGGFFQRALMAVVLAFFDYERLPLTALLAVTLVLAFSSPDRQRRLILLGAATAEFLHLMIGPFGWFHRYEIAIEFFAMLVLLPDLFRADKVSLSAFLLALLPLTYAGLSYVVQVPFAAGGIYRQQYQAHRFITQIVSGNLAVNDLGVAGYQRRPGQQIVDLYGLGSVEAATTRQKDAAWMDTITARSQVDWVVLYPEWFPDAIPASWHHMGTLCLRSAGGTTVFDPCVDYYSTARIQPSQADTAFARFAETLPATGVIGFPSR